MAKQKRTQRQIAADVLRTGRPPKDKEKLQTARLTVTMTENQRTRLGQAAKQDGLSLSAYLMRCFEAFERGR